MSSQNQRLPKISRWAATAAAKAMGSAPASSSTVMANRLDTFQYRFRSLLMAPSRRTVAQISNTKGKTIVRTTAARYSAQISCCKNAMLMVWRGRKQNRHP